MNKRASSLALLSTAVFVAAAAFVVLSRVAVDADGHNKIRLTNSAAGDGYPSWQPQ